MRVWGVLLQLGVTHDGDEGLVIVTYRMKGLSILIPWAL